MKPVDLDEHDTDLVNAIGKIKFATLTSSFWTRKACRSCRSIATRKALNGVRVGLADLCAICSQRFRKTFQDALDKANNREVL